MCSNPLGAVRPRYQSFPEFLKASWESLAGNHSSEGHHFSTWIAKAAYTPALHSLLPNLKKKGQGLWPRVLRAVNQEAKASMYLLLDLGQLFRVTPQRFWPTGWIHAECSGFLTTQWWVDATVKTPASQSGSSPASLVSLCSYVFDSGHLCGSLWVKT